MLFVPVGTTPMPLPPVYTTEQSTGTGFFFEKKCKVLRIRVQEPESRPFLTIPPPPPGSRIRNHFFRIQDPIA
jgi:hypothetical protein